jgi:hypothetical protein
MLGWEAPLAAKLAVIRKEEVALQVSPKRGMHAQPFPTPAMRSQHNDPTTISLARSNRAIGNAQMKAALFKAVNTALFVSTPCLLALAVFGTYVSINGNVLGTAQTFSCLALLNVM